MPRTSIVRAGLLGAAIALAGGVLTAAPAFAGYGPLRPPQPSPNFGCNYQGNNIGAGETVTLVDGEGTAIGLASCSMSDQLSIFWFPSDD